MDLLIFGAGLAAVTVISFIGYEYVMKRSALKNLKAMKHKPVGYAFISEIGDLIECPVQKKRFELIVDMVRITSDNGPLGGHIIWAYQASKNPQLPTASDIPDLACKSTIQA